MKFIYKLLINLALCLVISLIRVQTDTTTMMNNDENDIDLTGTLDVDKDVSAGDYHLIGDGGLCSARQCSDLHPECIKCNYNYSCVYGEQVNTTCMVLNDSKCIEGTRTFPKAYICAFCYQLPPINYKCIQQMPCQLYTRVKTLCTVHDDVLCLGNRKFSKFTICKYKSGYKWSTALWLSITLGGFGVDRFYLGNWQEGIGKLFSFGGLGIWTLIDVILIASGYLKPHDGSVYL